MVEQKKKSLLELEIELHSTLEAIKESKGPLVKEIEYTLLEPINYSHGGSYKKATQVILKAPRGKHIDIMNRATQTGLSGMLELIGCGELMIAKEDNVGINFVEFSDVDMRVLQELMVFYTRVFFPYL